MSEGDAIVCLERKTRRPQGQVATLIARLEVLERQLNNSAASVSNEKEGQHEA